MYVKYCENKPKSEYIVAEFIDFFEVEDCIWFVLSTLVNCSPLLWLMLSSVNIGHKLRL